jgi:hypothetical protein
MLETYTQATGAVVVVTALVAALSAVVDELGVATCANAAAVQTKAPMPRQAEESLSMMRAPFCRNGNPLFQPIEEY